MASCENVSNKKKLTVWTLPAGSPPAIRVEVASGKIIANKLLNIVLEALNIQERSKPYFSLFKGLDPPTKKFGEDEAIYVNCSGVVSVQKWSFDPAEEARAIKTDVAAIRLLAVQVNSDIVAGRLVPTLEEKEHLKGFMDPEFPCYKQYVDYARGIASYGSVVIKDLKLISNIRLKTSTVKKGNTIDIELNNKKMVIVTDRKELHIPWRKVRRWTEISDHASLGYEIYLMEEKAFTWIEVETNQAAYLLQVTCELVGRFQSRLQKAEFKKPAWAEDSSTNNKLTWKLFKKEVFGIGENPDPKQIFDTLEDEASSSDDNESENMKDYSRGSRSADRYSLQRS